MCDIDGLLTTTRSDGNLEGHKAFYAKNVEPMKELGEVVKKVKPTVIVFLPYLSSPDAIFIRNSSVVDYYWGVCNARSLHTRNSSRYGKIQ